MAETWARNNNELQNIKIAVVAIQLGIITLEQAQETLAGLQKRNISPTNENFGLYLKNRKFVTNQEHEILNFYIVNQSEICICNDCEKYFVVTNYRVNRNYTCPSCSSPMYMVRSPKAKFPVNELEPIDGLNSLSVPLVQQMQNSIKNKSYKEFRQFGFSESAVDSDDGMMVYDNNIPKPEAEDEKNAQKPSEIKNYVEKPEIEFEVTTKSDKTGAQKPAKPQNEKPKSDKLKKLNTFIKSVLPKKKISPEPAKSAKSAKSVKPTKPLPKKINVENKPKEIQKILRETAKNLERVPKKSVFASLKEKDLEVQLTDLKAPEVSDINAKIFPETVIGKKKLNIDSKITLSPIPSIGSKIKIASNDRYVLIKEIARGGMGVVYLAFDQDLRRYVAMKVIKPKENLKLRHLHRFIQESQILAQLEHPNNVPIHEFGVTTEGHLFFTMKYIEGISLAYLIAKYHRGSKLIRDNYPLKRQFELFLQIFDAISYAHARGVIHRDLKPENVMIGAFGEVVLMDWGLAKVKATREFVREFSETVVTSSKADFNITETNDGQVVGTPTYMPPEQTTGRAEHIDERVDIYALGAICYEILTGHPPFVERDVWKLINDIRSGNYPKLSELLPDIDPELERIISKAMHINKRMRYQSVLAFKTDLIKFLYSTTKSDLTSQKPFEETDISKANLKSMESNYGFVHEMSRNTVQNKRLIRKLKQEQKQTND